MEYVYLIREREFIRLDEFTYKIGRTTQSPNNRLNGYPKGSEVILFVNVDDCVKIEDIIIKVFTLKFKLMDEYGAEYFNGNKNDMIRTILKIILNPKSFDENEYLDNDKIKKNELTEFNIFEKTVDRFNKCDQNVNNKNIIMKNTMKLIADLIGCSVINIKNKQHKLPKFHKKWISSKSEYLYSFKNRPMDYEFYNDLKNNLDSNLKNWKWHQKLMNIFIYTTDMDNVELKRYILDLHIKFKVNIKYNEKQKFYIDKIFKIINVEKLSVNFIITPQDMDNIFYEIKDCQKMMRNIFKIRDRESSADFNTISCIHLIKCIFYKYFGLSFESYRKRIKNNENKIMNRCEYKLIIPDYYKHKLIK